MTTNTGETRTQIIELLEAGWDTGLSRDEIIEMLNFPPDVNPRRAVGVTLGHLAEDGIVTKSGDKFVLAEAERHPSPKPQADAALSSGTRIQLTDSVRNRSGANVAVYQSPIELEGVVKIQLLINGVWFSLPYAPSVRICVGPGIPQWSENQETTRGIIRIRLVKRDGQAVEHECHPSNPVTIDYA